MNANMSTITVEHTDDEYLEAIQQGIMSTPGMHINDNNAITIAKDVLRWLRQRRLIPIPDQKKIIAKTLLKAGGRGYPVITEPQADYIAHWIDTDLSMAGFVIASIDQLASDDLIKKNNG